MQDKALEKNHQIPVNQITDPMNEHIELEGRILAVLAGTVFRVQINHTRQVLARVSGKLRWNFVRLGIGDRVKMQMSPYDLNNARIVFRLS
jgi:translation initiation factor IF-1